MRRAPSRQISSIPEPSSAPAAFSATTFNIGVPSFLAGVRPPASSNWFNEEGTPRPRSGGRSTGSGYNSRREQPQRRPLAENYLIGASPQSLITRIEVLRLVGHV